MPESQSNGRAVATMLAGAWRSSPPRLETPVASLSKVIPLLVESGAGALAWWRIRQSSNRVLPHPLRQLRATYLRYAVQSIEHEREIVEVVSILRSCGVEPILLKGWAIARAYPETGLRPCGDIDLYVSPDQYTNSHAALYARQRCFSVDLIHDTITRFSEQTYEELYFRSQLVNLDGTEVRVLAAEDHLRIVCLHMLKHGAWRPLWLCDIAAALESRTEKFDWDRCLGKNARHADWILCALALAGRLLGAETRDTPAHDRTKTLPEWLLRSTLKQWSAAHPSGLPLFVDQVAGRWWRLETLRAIRKRWPNPIQATVDAGGSFNAMTRLPFQIRDCALRTVRLCRQLPGLLRN